MTSSGKTSDSGAAGADSKPQEGDAKAKAEEAKKAAAAAAAKKAADAKKAAAAKQLK